MGSREKTTAILLGVMAILLLFAGFYFLMVHNDVIPGWQIPGGEGVKAVKGTRGVGVERKRRTAGNIRRKSIGWKGIASQSGSKKKRRTKRILLRGRVFERGVNQPLAKVRVLAKPMATAPRDYFVWSAGKNGGIFDTRSDEGGSFSLQVVPQPFLTVGISKKGYSKWRKHLEGLDLKPDGCVVDLGKIFLERKRKVNFKVVDETGLPLPGVCVYRFKSIIDISFSSAGGFQPKTCMPIDLDSPVAITNLQGEACVFLSNKGERNRYLLLHKRAFPKIVKEKEIEGEGGEIKVVRLVSGKGAWCVVKGQGGIRFEKIEVSITIDELGVDLRRKVCEGARSWWGGLGRPGISGRRVSVTGWSKIGIYEKRRIIDFSDGKTKTIYLDSPTTHPITVKWSTIDNGNRIFLGLNSWEPECGFYLKESVGVDPSRREYSFFEPPGKYFVSGYSKSFGYGKTAVIQHSTKESFAKLHFIATKVRKLVVNVVDLQGKPVAGSDVSIFVYPDENIFPPSLKTKVQRSGPLSKWGSLLFRSGLIRGKNPSGRNRYGGFHFVLFKRTNMDGVCAFDRLPLSPIKVEASHPGYCIGRVFLDEKPGKEVKVVLRPGSKLEIKLFGDAVPLLAQSGGAIELVDPMEGETILRNSIGVSGTVNFQGLEPKSYLIRAVVPRFTEIGDVYVLGSFSNIWTPFPLFEENVFLENGKDLNISKELMLPLVTPDVQFHFNGKFSGRLKICNPIVDRRKRRKKHRPEYSLDICKRSTYSLCGLRRGPYFLILRESSGKVWRKFFVFRRSDGLKFYPGLKNCVDLLVEIGKEFEGRISGVRIFPASQKLGLIYPELSFTGKRKAGHGYTFGGVPPGEYVLEVLYNGVWTPLHKHYFISKKCGVLRPVIPFKGGK